MNSTLAIQESTLGRSGKDGEAPSGNLVKSGGEVDITKLLSLLCRCNKVLHVAAIFLLAGCGEDGQSRVSPVWDALGFVWWGDARFTK
jgi:hypothetical protein